MPIELRELRIGERGRVTGFKSGDIGHRQKLLSMGLTPGAEFTVVRVAPLGDPVEVRVRDASISLRRDEVSALMIERLSAGAAVDESEPLTIAIIGNPNCGKTTLFNGLTGANQRVGNWPGVTVEQKAGFFRVADQRFKLVDLPGIYSLDAYKESGAIDESIARDYVLSGEADLIVNLVDTGHLELSLYLTTQLLEMRAPLVVVLNIMEEDEGRLAKFDVEAVQRRLGCPARAVVVTKRSGVDEFKSELRHLAHERLRPRFTLGYPPLVEDAVMELSGLIRDTSGTGSLDGRWLAIRLLERDAFAARQVDPAVNEARERLGSKIAQETGDEADVVIANGRYRFGHVLAGEALPERAPLGHGISARIDSVVLNRLLGIPIFLGVMYCLFWFTITFARAFKPFVLQLANTFFVEGFRQILGTVHSPAWLTALIADGLGNGLLQVVNFIPIIGFLYLFLSVIEESGYMARANFVMDRLMKALGLPGNAFVPMVVGFGCNVPSIMATRTMERPRDRIVAVLMSPFMSCGGRLAVYTIFAAAFFPDHGQFVIFGVYLLGIVFAMITALMLKHSLLPQESSLYALQLPSYHWPKLRNVLISAWIRVKAFVFRVGKFIIPLVLVLQVLSMWGTDGSFHKQPIDHSMLAAGGRAITPVLAPMGVGEDQWPATVAILTGVLHKVVIVSTLDAIYMEASHKPAQAFNLFERIKQAFSTVGINLKALIAFDSPTPVHQFQSGLAPALASHFDGTVGALAYLILVLCYPCIATTAATTRETHQRWTAIMIFWTVSLGYGMAVLFYQIGTFPVHPVASAAWALAVTTYFAILGTAAVKFAPLSVNAYPLRSLGVRKDEALAVDRLHLPVPSHRGVAWTLGGALAVVALGAVLVAYGPKFMTPQQAAPGPVRTPQPAPAHQPVGGPSALEPSATVERHAGAALRAKEGGSALEMPAESVPSTAGAGSISETKTKPAQPPEQAEPKVVVEPAITLPAAKHVVRTREDEEAASVSPKNETGSETEEAATAPATAERGSILKEQAAAAVAGNEVGAMIGGASEAEPGQSVTIEPTGDAAGESSKEYLFKAGKLDVGGAGVEANLIALLEGKAKPAGPITWFDFDRVTFETGKATLQPSSQEQLKDIAKMLSAFPSAKIIIAGHTDSAGNARTNKRISEARAESVLRKLTHMGVEASRLEAKGYGGDRPVASNDTGEGRARNRRISLGVIRE